MGLNLETKSDSVDQMVKSKTLFMSFLIPIRS